MKKFSLKFIAKSGIIAAMYFALSMLLQPINYGPIQFRLAEALVMLPYLMPEGIVGVTIGCLLANIFSPFALYDMIFGTLATLIASFLTYKIKNIWLAGLPPIIINAIVLPLMWKYLAKLEVVYWVSVGEIIVSEAVIVYALGIPLIILLKKAMPNIVNNPKFLDNTKHRL